MPAPWRWLGHIGRIIPDVIGNPVYDLVQRNRFDWFGKRATCFMPSAAERQRFLLGQVA
jgi:predicted DCC family thiol-disulfide oxidoreductase YuxK